MQVYPNIPFQILKIINKLTIQQYFFMICFLYTRACDLYIHILCLQICTLINFRIYMYKYIHLHIFIYICETKLYFNSNIFSVLQILYKINTTFWSPMQFSTSGFLFFFLFLLDLHFQSNSKINLWLLRKCEMYVLGEMICHKPRASLTTCMLRLQGLTTFLNWTIFHDCIWGKQLWEMR